MSGDWVTDDEQFPAGSYFQPFRGGRRLSHARGRLRPVNTRLSPPCLVHPEIQKLFKIFRHIVSCGTYMKH